MLSLQVGMAESLQLFDSGAQCLAMERLLEVIDSSSVHLCEGECPSLTCYVETSLDWHVNNQVMCMCVCVYSIYIYIQHTGCSFQIVGLGLQQPLSIRALSNCYVLSKHNAVGGVPAGWKRSPMSF